MLSKLKHLLKLIQMSVDLIFCTGRMILRVKVLQLMRDLICLRGVLNRLVCPVKLRLMLLFTILTD